ncbi:hypothetical protein LDO26_05865 [Luteimonas sp. BDR2-5]|uniref:hypothetical protein n=1 Tax=Proluteimonas luteida TaxID=2878685 RepID=UPI001E452592|nr:hypothetical protein [Luteimonas sp. BDR2-5]MCD9027731.1 hypothetical protein [Luteimonas sp. BDR2-5]
MTAPDATRVSRLLARQSGARETALSARPELARHLLWFAVERAKHPDAYSFDAVLRYMGADADAEFRAFLHELHLCDNVSAYACSIWNDAFVCDVSAYLRSIMDDARLPDPVTIASDLYRRAMRTKDDALSLELYRLASEYRRGDAK